jgi:hypothetical protein
MEMLNLQSTCLFFPFVKIAHKRIQQIVWLIVRWGYPNRTQYKSFFSQGTSFIKCY